MKRRESGMYTEDDGVSILIGGEENQGAYHASVVLIALCPLSHTANVADRAMWCLSIRRQIRRMAAGTRVVTDGDEGLVEKV